MSLFALIGGKTNKEILNNKIERYIVSLANKDKPIVLHCPYASIKDMNKSNEKFMNLMKGIECEIINLTLDNLNEFDSLLDKCDIFYISGGWCDDLIRFFKENKLDQILKKFINSNKIFAGSSAGAMLYTKASMGDKYVYYDNYHYYNFKMVECLGILNITICPHYQTEDLIVYNDELKKYQLPAFGIENDTMVVIDNDKFYIVKEDNNRSVYYFDKNNNYLMVPLYEGVLYEKNSGFRP